MYRFAVTGERAIRRVAFVWKWDMAGCGCDLSAEEKSTRNGFVLYSGAKRGLK